MAKIEYKCGECGATGCKLWREYGTYHKIYLACAPCAAKNQGRDISTIDADGMREAPEYVWMKGERTDTIGWYVPAVQTAEGDYWGATATPLDAYAIWQKLPTLPA